MGEEKLKIGIDIDDVSLDFLPTFLEYCKTRNPPLEIINGMKGHIGEWFGLSREGFRKVHRDFTSTDFYDNMSLVEGFADAYPELINFSTSILITSRAEKRKKRTLNCYQKQIPGFNFPIYFSGEFHGGNLTKGNLCRELGVRYHIDDNPSYLDSCLRENVHVFLFNRPWNEDYPDNKTKNVTRVFGWEDIIDKIKQEVKN